LTTVPWGMSPADDQQLGGLIMWMVGGMFLSAGGIFALFLNVTEKE
jgi:putative membrane protein